MSNSPTDPAGPQADAPTGDAASVELSSNRTSLSFERTLMSADRTLMGIIRTALSLISFGFTIYEIFHQLERSGAVDLNDGAARNFGLALVVLGILMLGMGVAGHVRFGGQLTDRRERLVHRQLLRREIHYGRTPTFIIAVLLLLVGLAAAGSIVFRVIAQ